ncbi:hypothetical protein COHA_009346 [Chlorella ohadii]|uniref:Fibronectin type-III domain-containing protein n=1 Tax=Chlorella ohadii TaxID=2649997 RepID=A0AAD5DH80_9CHLO|nr:hypothetical protein COHA_009346 [Chlorella ohadii]
MPSGSDAVVLFSTRFAGYTAETFGPEQRERFIADFLAAAVRTTGLPPEVLTVRILAVRNAAPTRRLQGDSSASVVVVDASLSVDTPRNPESGQAATTSVVDNLLLEPAALLSAFDSGPGNLLEVPGGGVQLNGTPVQTTVEEPVGDVVCSATQSCLDSTVCRCPDEAPNCLTTTTTSGASGVCVNLCEPSKPQESCTTNCQCPSTLSRCGGDGQCQGTPGAPEVVTAGYDTATWRVYADIRAPSSDGGAAITAYAVQGKSSNGAVIFEAEGAGTAIAGGLLRFTFANAFPYETPVSFRARAINSRGPGLESEAFPFTTPPPQYGYCGSNDACSLTDPTSCVCPAAFPNCLAASARCWRLAQVNSLLPTPTNGKYPYDKWFVYFLTGPTAELQVVSLASQTSAPASLTANPPGGVTGALKLVTLDATYKDKAYAGVLFPPAELSSTPGSPAQGGLFGGVLFKTFATDASTRLSYDWYRLRLAENFAAPTLRLLLRSPAYDAANPGTAPKLVNVVYEPYWQPPVNHKPQFEQWVNEAITAASGSNRPVDTKFGNTDPAGTTNGGGWWVNECKFLNYGGTEGCGDVVRSLQTIANYYATRAPAFMDDAYIIGITMALSNPQSTGYTSNIEAQYSGQRLKWQFQPAA